MKKFTLTLLLIFGTVSALFAQQSVREDIFAFLKREGYVPTFDEDRDILFKVQGILRHHKRSGGHGLRLCGGIGEFHCRRPL